VNIVLEFVTEEKRSEVGEKKVEMAREGRQGSIW
jgi:hypothetical protein